MSVGGVLRNGAQCSLPKIARHFKCVLVDNPASSTFCARASNLVEETKDDAFTANV